MMEFTQAMIVGFLTGLGISFLFLISLVILGVKMMNNGKYFGNPKSDDQEIT